MSKLRGPMSLQAQATEAIKTGKARSFNVERSRRQIVKAEFKQLGKMFKGLKIKNLQERHIQRLVDRWKSQNISIGSMKNRMSAIRCVANGAKIELPKENSAFGIDDRKIDYNSDKSWTPSNELLTSLPKDKQLHVGLMYHFGMRFEEAAKFQVKENDLRGVQDVNAIISRIEKKGKTCPPVPTGDKIFIDYGPKNGRDRFTPVLTNEQRNLLDEIKKFCKETGRDSLMPRAEKYITWKNHAEYTYKSVGMTKEGVGTCHGLRHHHFQERYEKITGWKAPCTMTKQERIDFKKSITKEMKETDRYARQTISYEAGHGRIHVSANYLGSW
ncbi:integrase domain-containing protein [Patescibacteria group bacterium]|nr:integrase domain-containing protein [Patescibacteria group bacterium]